MTTHEQSEMIRQEIESTREDMSETIDAIQEQLHPENLKVQAQEAVRSSIQDGADAITEYVRTNQFEIGESLMDAIKRNPVPAALVGLGLGWLLVDSLSDNSSSGRWQTDGVDYPIQQYRGDMYRPDRDQMRYYDERYRQSRGYAYPDNQNWMHNTVDNMQDTATSAAAAVQDTVSEIGSSIQDTASSAVDSVRDAAGRVSEKVQGVASNVTDRMQSTAEEARAHAEYWGSEANQQASQLNNQAQYYKYRTSRQAQYAGNQVQRSINDNPFLFGAVAFGVGALIATMLPGTRYENEWMGEARDELLDTAHSATQDVAQRAQNVVDEVVPQVQQSVEKIVDDVKEAGRNSVEDLKKASNEAVEEAKDTLQTAKVKAQTEAEKAKADLENRAQNAKETVKEKSGTNY